MPRVPLELLRVVSLRQLLLTWWEVWGRHTMAWKLRPDGDPAEPGEPLDPYPIWVAEVMRAARQHSSRMSPGSPQCDEGGACSWC